MKTGDPWLLPLYVEIGTCIFAVWWHTLWQLGKAFNNQHGSFKYDIIQTIHRHKRPYNKNIKQKPGYLLGHLKSNVKLSPRHPQWSHHYERPKNWVLLKKRFGMLLREPLFLGKWCGVATYFSYKKIRKKYKYKLHIQNMSFSLIE